MKNKCVKVFGSIFMMFLMLGALSGCTKHEVVKIEPMEIEEVDTYSVDVIGGKDVMPIMGFYTPLTSTHSSDGNAGRDFLTDEFFQDLEDAGINIIISNPRTWQNAQALTLKTMDFAAEHGIGVVVSDTVIDTAARRKEGDKTFTAEEALLTMSEYMTHPGFAGIYMYDEPATSYYPGNVGIPTMDAFSDIAKVLNKELGVMTYQNLCGIGTSKRKETFEQYLTEYCETQSPNYIMFDKYPFEKEIRGKEYGYLYNLATFREYGQKYNIPWWSFIQCGSQWNDAASYKTSVTPYYPNEGEFDWSVNMNLAFGAKGLNYFTLVQPHYFAYGTEQGDYDFQRNSMFGAWGNKNQWYYYAKDINEHVRVIDEVLMNSVSKGILATGEEAKALCRDTRDALMKGTAWRELKAVEGDAVIGCFNYQGKTALYVVNASFDYAQDITLNFVSKYKVTVMQDAKTNHISADSVTLKMPAGDGVLLVFES